MEIRCHPEIRGGTVPRLSKSIHNLELALDQANVGVGDGTFRVSPMVRTSLSFVTT